MVQGGHVESSLVIPGNLTTVSLEKNLAFLMHFSPFILTATATTATFTRTPVTLGVVFPW